MVEDIDITTDQSSFAASQAVLQAPPTTPNEAQKNPNKKLWLLIGIILFILVATLLVVGAPRKRKAASTPTPQPSATPAAASSAMTQQLNQLQEQVQTANPDDVLEPPPQVDMEIAF